MDGYDPGKYIIKKIYVNMHLPHPVVSNTRSKEVEDDVYNLTHRLDPQAVCMKVIASCNIISVQPGKIHGSKTT